MPISRRNTPPTSQIKEQLSVLSSLSAWTDTNESEETSKKALKTHPGGFKELRDETEDPSLQGSLQSRFISRTAPYCDVESEHFNTFFGLVIVANAVVIGLETDYGRDSFTGLEHVFNCIFLTEICIRVRQLGADYFKEPWNIFDCVLVLIGTLDLWILPLCTMGGGNNIGYKLSVIRMLRVLRLLRVLRVIRLFRMFHQLYLIMQAFTKAFQMVMLISVLVFILDYVCAIILTQSVGQHSADWGEDAAQIEAWFGTISRSMQTLFVIMTLSGWEKIALMLTDVLPVPVVLFSFVLYIMVTSYTLVSLITGIISESLITSQGEYKHRKLQSMDGQRKELAATLRSFLEDMLDDRCDGNRSVEADDLKQSVRGDQELLGKLASIGSAINERGILNLIDSLSNDGQERVCIDYFVDKLTNLTNTANASAVVDLKHDVVRTQQQLTQANLKIDALIAKLFPGQPVFPEAMPTAPRPSKRSESSPKPTSTPAAASKQLHVNVKFDGE